MFLCLFRGRYPVPGLYATLSRKPESKIDWEPWIIACCLSMGTTQLLYEPIWCRHQRFWIARISQALQHWLRSVAAWSSTDPVTQQETQVLFWKMDEREVVACFKSFRNLHGWKSANRHSKRWTHDCESETGETATRNSGTRCGKMAANCAFRRSEQVLFIHHAIPIKQAEENELRNQNSWDLTENRNRGSYTKHNYCDLWLHVDIILECCNDSCSIVSHNAEA